MPRPPDLLNLIAWLAALWLAAAAVLLILVSTSTWVPLHWTSDVYLGATVLFSVIAFGAMGLDKLKARRGKRRISEFSLHLFELLGGWGGSLLGQRTFHHKTSKITYQTVFWGIVCVHLVLIAWMVYMWNTLPSNSTLPAPTEPAKPAAVSAKPDTKNLP